MVPLEQIIPLFNKITDWCTVCEKQLVREKLRNYSSASGPDIVLVVDLLGENKNYQPSQACGGSVSLGYIQDL